MGLHGDSINPQLLISRTAIRHNVKLIRTRMRKGTRICAMVKADGYGHGADIVVEALCNHSNGRAPSPAVDQLGVACIEEAEALRGKSALPILVFRTLESNYLERERDALETAVRCGWILTVSTTATANDLARIAQRLSARAKVHVMIDTGMTRCGCGASAAPGVIASITSHQSLELASIGTHFATADVKHDSAITEQFSRFQKVVSALNGQKAMLTAANSGAILFAPETHLDLVRPGIALYGVHPSCRPNTQEGLQPVAKWTAPILSILEANRGTFVGYGRTWQAPHDTRIGLIPIGYADGYLRSWGNRMVMGIHSKWAPVVGRVSMDLTTIDLHDVPEARVGDQVTIMDSDPASPVSVYALADRAGTIPYEVFTRIGRRIKRVLV